MTRYLVRYINLGKKGENIVDTEERFWPECSTIKDIWDQILEWNDVDLIDVIKLTQ
jgi:hypothetical protein